jgi:hypothetical protein
MSMLVLPAVIAGFAGRSDRDPAEDLLGSLARGGLAPPVADPVTAATTDRGT